MSQLAFAFGLLGNIISFMVLLAPLPTFHKIYKKRSTEGFQSIPYVVGLFSAMLWIYYAFLKPDTTLLITINSVGCFGHTAYICFYLFYAPKNAKVQTVKLLLLLNVIGFGLIILLTHFLANGSNRANIVGWICLVFSLCVFVAPLCIVIPNVLGFIFGVLQMVLYVIYKNSKKVVPEKRLSEIQSEIIADNHHDHKFPSLLKEKVIDIVKLNAMVQIIPLVPILVDSIDEPILEAKKPEQID
ncbi:hypothetical protein BUALT_Bualt02G0091500 [Buddleja alternifolia]|uniref:Bidirectional sugar transporter SWEET n=1 Tax=Buddleja alternifolia TaxID=168488 RepID=A0AAV6XZ74_9LAMI|nr:hypothetical protein BUALT_Bualt02G0091500 [Buddleja alternifolia]